MSCDAANWIPENSPLAQSTHNPVAYRCSGASTPPPYLSTTAQNYLSAPMCGRDRRRRRCCRSHSRSRRHGPWVQKLKRSLSILFHTHPRRSPGASCGHLEGQRGGFLKANGTLRRAESAIETILRPEWWTLESRRSRYGARE